jgi:hypothetical protein
MVIELRADVKHIDSKISDLVEIASRNNDRICLLEQYRSEEVGRAKGVAATATATSVVVSLVISVVAIFVGALLR